MLAAQLKRLAEGIQEVSHAALDATQAFMPLVNSMEEMRREAGLREHEEFAEYLIPVGALQIGMDYAETSYTEDGKDERWHLQCLACDVAWVEDPDVETSMCWLCERTFSVPLARQRYDAHCNRRLDKPF